MRPESLICTRDDENLSTFAYKNSPPGFEHHAFKAVSWSLAVCQVSYSLNSDLRTQYLIAEMFSNERFYKQKRTVNLEVAFKKITNLPKVPAHSGLAILDCRKRKRRHWHESHKIDKLYESSNDSSRTVERLEEKSNDVSVVYLYDYSPAASVTYLAFTSIQCFFVNFYKKTYPLAIV